MVQNPNVLAVTGIPGLLEQLQQVPCYFRAPSCQGVLMVSVLGRRIRPWR
jgi:hypothetical protein